MLCVVPRGPCPLSWEPRQGKCGASSPHPSRRPLTRVPGPAFTAEHAPFSSLTVSSVHVPAPPAICVRLDPNVRLFLLLIPPLVLSSSLDPSPFMCLFPWVPSSQGRPDHTLHVHSHPSPLGSSGPALFPAAVVTF